VQKIIRKRKELDKLENSCVVMTLKRSKTKELINVLLSESVKHIIDRSGQKDFEVVEGDPSSDQEAESEGEEVHNFKCDIDERKELESIIMSSPVSNSGTDLEIYESNSAPVNNMRKIGLRPWSDARV
jgi:hypothetical protein